MIEVALGFFLTLAGALFCFGGRQLWNVTVLVGRIDERTQDHDRRIGELEVAKAERTRYNDSAQWTRPDQSRLR